LFYHGLSGQVFEAIMGSKKPETIKNTVQQRKGLSKRASAKKDMGGNAISVNIGNISDFTGNINISSGDIKTISRQISGLSPSEVNLLFKQVQKEVKRKARASAVKKADSVKNEVREIHNSVAQAVKKKEKVDEGFLKTRFRNIAKIAPDILEIIIATLASPPAGLGVAAKKIADKAKEGTKAN
jgi:hypothetical protein